MDRRVDDLVKKGLSETEARRQARLELGGVPQVQEAVRDTWTSQWLDALVRDVRYAIRSLTRSWGFTVGASLILALAIGASVATFSMVSTCCGAYLGTIIVLGSAALLATLLPAMRAVMIAPVIVLQQE